MKNGRVTYLWVCPLLLAILVVGCHRKPEVKQVANQTPQVDALQMHATSDGQEASGVSGILFLRNDTIWRADNNGRNIRAVSSIGYSDTYFWIPKTRRVVVHAMQDNRALIKIASVDSSREELVWETNLPEDEPGSDVGSMFYFSISVSRDGNIIAFGGDFVSLSDRETKVYNATTKSMRSVACRDGFLSPDGTKLAWVREYNIYLTSLVDTSIQQLTHFENAGAVYNANPRAYYNLETVHEIVGWSRDGSAVLYNFGNYGQGAENAVATTHIYSINIVNGEVGKLTHTGNGQIDHFFDQSSDGRTLYYSVMDIARSNYVSNSIMRADVISDSVVEITPPSMRGLRERSYNVSSLFCSSSLLVFGWHDKYGETLGPAVFVMNQDGTSGRKLIDSASSPKWMVNE